MQQARAAAQVCGGRHGDGVQRRGRIAGQRERRTATGADRRDEQARRALRERRVAGGQRVGAQRQWGDRGDERRVWSAAGDQAQHALGQAQRAARPRAVAVHAHEIDLCETPGRAERGGLRGQRAGARDE